MKVTTKRKLYDAKQLYLNAFPKEERLPWWILRLMSLPKAVNINTYYDGDKFIGFCHTTATKDTLFVMFFAVNENLRGKGYGSAILKQMKQLHSDKAIILNVEPLDDQAENADQRKMRMRFYERNGFWDTGYDITEVGGVFRVLSTQKNLNVKAYLRVFKLLSLGMWRPDITAVK